MTFAAIDSFRRKLRAGQTCVGAGITFSDPLITEALADSVDFLWIDLEHTSMGPEAMAGHLLAARGRNVPALVRVRGSDTHLIKPVLDAGAEGIIVPQVQSAEEAGSALADCRYPPVGTRGFGPRVPSNYGRWESKHYVPEANEKLFVAVQIETSGALEQIDEILSLPGLDSVVIGPWDLSGALGVLGEVTNAAVVSAMETIVSKAVAKGVFVGAGMGADPTFVKMMVARGVQWLQAGADFAFLIQGADRIRAVVRGEQPAGPTEGPNV